MPGPQNRPTSPHLQIYRLPLAALLSISHRISGVALSAGMFVLVAWLVCAGFGTAACFENTKKLFDTGFGQFALFGWVLAFFYHMCSGIRHMVWDTGRGFEKQVYKITNWVVIGAALLLTAVAWIYASGAMK